MEEIEAYDRAVDSALERDENPEEYLLWRTTARKSADPLQIVLEQHWNSLRVKQDRENLLDALSEVRDMIDDYVDVIDGDYGEPEANKAMRAVARIDEAVSDAERKPNAPSRRKR